jgi:hypothetical protein
MRRHTSALATTAMAIGLVASACGGSSNSGTGTSSSTSQAATTTSQATATTTTSGGPQLQSLIPTPANTQRTDGPDAIPGNGIHEHFFVNGAPTDVMNAYKSALEAAGWAVTVVNSGSGGEGSGATYTANHGDTYGVFNGGGSFATDIDACAWPSKPANPNCGGTNR